MKAIELAKAYDPKSFEDRLYAEWKGRGMFQPRATAVGSAGKKPFVIVIPPPNVTGVLHMGHGLNNSLQDIVIRYHRMRGEPTLWVPGTDHAGIATQHVVEKRLKARGILRRELGREKFVAETWKVKEEHHAVITKQLEKIGASCDWSRERFTLDEGLSKAVREVFVTLYERGLVYKGKYLVNWCPTCGTALADDEVEHEDAPGVMHHIRYEIVDPPSFAADGTSQKAGEVPDPASRGVIHEDGKFYIVIATTRPETLLGDSAVACNPSDERYKALVGCKLRLPLTDRIIPLIADNYVDMAFGTGLVKITPAHDPNDFEVGNRHDLERINILNPDGTLGDRAPAKYSGMSIKDGRAAVVADLKELGLFVDEKPITHSVGSCYRCHHRVEPYLSEQWFVKMQPLADKALKAWRNGEVRFFPQRWENTYEQWLTNIRDWCISRQLWWGHRIPAWHCAHCGKTVVAREEPGVCPFCQSTELTQDEDVLDTWFSSWLWPFSTLGWPKDTADLRKYYPTTALVTGYDIIFFWVARMIMAGLEFTDQVPFRDICLTTLVRDKQGRKMSKSLGNGIDPLEIVSEYGADALKFTLAFMFTSGQDILINKDDFKLGSKFSNKVWNASRYLLMNLEGRELVETPALNDIDRWIHHRLNEAATAMKDALSAYRFNDAASTAYEFFWNDFCDWYVEASKLSLRSDDEAEKDRAMTVLISLLAESLRLLHPLLPFVTEEIFGMLPGNGGVVAAGSVGSFDSAGGASSAGEVRRWLIIEPYPEPRADRDFPEAAAGFEALRELVTGVRAIRSEFGIPMEKAVRVVLHPEAGSAAAAFLPANLPVARLLMNAESLELAPTKPSGSVGVVGRGFEAWALVRDAVDGAKLVDKLRKDIDREHQFVERTGAKLGNEGFVASAPPEVVAREREKLTEAERRVARLSQYLGELA